MGILNWLEAGFIGTWVRESLWSYAILLTLHSLGMAFLVGTSFVLALRVLGASDIGAASLGRYTSVVWAGFVVSALSGIALFAGQATSIAASRTFLLKMALIVLGALLTRRLAVHVYAPRAGAEAAPAAYPQSIKLVAAAALTFWVGAIVAGRLTAYLP